MKSKANISLKATFSVISLIGITNLFYKWGIEIIWSFFLALVFVLGLVLIIENFLS